ncbi:MAG: hypothetical protein CFE26_22980, partial [Verrucomicrobiales bacterium VVV1]
MWARYGKFVIGLAVVVILGVAGVEGWRYWQNKQSETAGDAFFSASKLAASGKAAEAVKQFESIDKTGFADLGRMRAAAAVAAEGKAAEAVKLYDAVAADATVDGKGVVIGNPAADYRNSAGYVLTGPEFFTLFDGLTGAALATTNYFPARNSDPTSANVNAWGDNYGNRVDRFLAGVAYLDGTRPSLVMCRGYYT